MRRQLDRAERFSPTGYRSWRPAGAATTAPTGPSGQVRWLQRVRLRHAPCAPRRYARLKRHNLVAFFRALARASPESRSDGTTMARVLCCGGSC